jgi:hypothetical protein
MKKYKLHTSCSTLPIYSFDKLIETLDYRYLIVDYFGDKSKYKKFNTKGNGEEIFNIILKEYAIITSDVKQIKNLKHLFLITELEYKYNVTTRILKLYEKTESLEVLWVLEDIGWKLRRDIPYGHQIENITKLCIGLKNKIKIQKINYTKKYEKKEKENKNKISLSKQAIYLQSNLELGYFLDTKTCSVETWNNLINLSEEKNAYYEKNKISNRRK